MVHDLEVTQGVDMLVLLFRAHDLQLLLLLGKIPAMQSLAGSESVKELFRR